MTKKRRTFPRRLLSALGVKMSGPGFVGLLVMLALILGVLPRTTGHVAAQGPEVIYSFPLDSNPGWTTEGDWAWGEPQGNAGDHGLPDPTSGYTGGNVYGYNLNGAYPNSMGEMSLTTAALDFSGYGDITLRFRRWLNVERSRYDHAYIRVSIDGSNWTTVWENDDTDRGDGASVVDTSWQLVEYNLPDFVNDSATVYVRWVMGTTDGGWTYSGWNIDDVEVLGTLLPPMDCVTYSDDFDDGDTSLWTSTLVGGVSGTAAEAGGLLTLTSSNGSIWSSSDRFHYYYESGISGDFDVRVKLNSMGGNNSAYYPKGGLMVRQSVAVNSANVMFNRVDRTSNNLQFARRGNAGGSTSGSYTEIPGSPDVPPVWLRLARVGDAFTAYYSTNGIVWTQASGGPYTVAFTDPVLVGLTVAGGDGGPNDPIEFDDFQLCVEATTTSNPPTEPTNLLVDGQSNPSDVTNLTPTFSWQFNDPDAGDVQGAWQIQVNTEPDFSGAMMWNSGKVYGGVSSAVYAGNELALDGMTYYWRVRTWDDHNAQGPWSAFPGHFFTMRYVPPPPDVALFDNFQLCPEGAGGGTFAREKPPLLRECGNVLSNADFPGGDLSPWVDGAEAPAVYANGSYSSDRDGRDNYGFSMYFMCDRVQFGFFEPYHPWAYQEFTVPSFISTTEPVTVEMSVSLYYGVPELDPTPVVNPYQNTYGRAEDKLQVLVTRLDDTSLTTSAAEITHGAPPSSDRDRWHAWTGDLAPLFPVGDPLTNYVGQSLRLRIEAPNVDTDGDGNEDGDSQFYIDQVRCEICATIQPPPYEPGQARRLGGYLQVLVYGNPTPMQGIDVWAIQLPDGGAPPPGGWGFYTTYSIHDSTYNFYNLNPGTYRIYAEVWVSGALYSASTTVTIGVGQENTGVNMTLG